MAGQTLLLVDDDSLARAYLREALGTTEHRLVEARNGAEALAHISASRPALVLLDLVMPVMSGLEVLEFLRRLSFPPRVLVLSSLSERSLVSEALAAGAWGFLPKPCPSRQVQRTVAQSLEH